MNNRIDSEKVVSITYEEIGLFPRSFNRVFDRFFKQLFFDVENLVIQEYRFYRYLFLTTVKCVFILLFVPMIINFVAKNYLVRPIVGYYWNAHQTEIFLNSYQQKRAFIELQNFQEKIYFESFILSNPISFNKISYRPINRSLAMQSNSNNRSQLIGINRQSIGLREGVIPMRLLNRELFYGGVNSNRLSHLIAIPRGGYFMGAINKIKSNRIGAININNRNSLLIEKNLLSYYIIGDSYPIELHPLIDQAPWQLNRKLAILGNPINTIGYKRASNSYENKIGSKFVILSNSSANQKFSKIFTKSIQNSVLVETIQLAKHYNEESIEAITNFFADFISLSTLLILLFRLEIQLNITKSFLLEVFFGLDDSKKSLCLLFVTDLLVGYHSPNIWELFFSSIFDRYGLPESQTTIFLLVATLPVLLDVLFKYLIFRHLNRASPATVATYHAMIE